MARTLARGLCMLVALALCDSALAEVYRWVDRDGTTHYSDRVEDVPAGQRRALGIEEAAPKGSGSFTVVPGLNGPPPGQEGQAAAGQRPAPPPAALDEEALLDLARTAQQQGGSPLAQLGQLGSLGAGKLALVLGIFGVLMLVGLSIAALFLLLACRMCREPEARFPRALGTAALQILAAIPVGVALYFLLGPPPHGLALQAGQAGLGFAVNTGVVRAVLVPSLGKAALVTFVSIVLTIAASMLLAGLAFCAGLGAALSG